MWTRRAGSVVLTMLALAAAVSRGDDNRKGAPATPANPDPGFLEFLGSVDRLVDVNPDYLSQSGRPQAAKPPAKGAVASPPASLPPTAASGVKNND
jgi:hypothetical protein